MQFRDFHRALRIQYGEDAAAVRHELYFLSLRGRSAVLRAVLALLRDAWLCATLPRRAMPVAGWAALATLPGSNGWGALAPCVADLARRGIACTVLIHPRLRGQVAGQLPARPPASAWRHAWSAWRLRHAPGTTPVAAPWLVRCCVFRQRLWCGAWSSVMCSGTTATLLLHNDFDLYAVAAQQAAGTGWRSICVQHGLPTEEFFPVRAQHHLLWGPSSAEVYARHGVAAHACSYGPARPQVEASAHAAPSVLYLVSQTHTPVYGLSLAGYFQALADALIQARLEGITLQILLHPEEVRNGHPYAKSAMASLCRPPPHALLEDTAAPALVVGFCSTALLQAACRGHYVIGLAWPASGSADAQEIGRPAQQVPDVTTLCALVRRLREDACTRGAFLERQQQWLSRNFASDPDWPSHVGASQ